VTPPAILLASTSPRRREILAQLGLPFEVVPPTYEERDPPGAGAVELTQRHARGKASSVASRRPERPVLGVDTAVVLGGRVYGKSATPAEAAATIRSLAGRTHVVVSGLCLLGDGFEDVEHAETRVTFRPLAEPEIAAYVASGQWRGLAGAYAIQGRAAAFATAIAGDYWNVVGLPVALLVRVLARRYPGVYGYR
jgi:septum formation protein